MPFVVSHMFLISISHPLAISRWLCLPPSHWKSIPRNKLGDFFLIRTQFLFFLFFFFLNQCFVGEFLGFTGWTYPLLAFGYTLWQIYDHGISFLRRRKCFYLLSCCHIIIFKHYDIWVNEDRRRRGREWGRQVQGLSVYKGPWTVGHGLFIL